MKTYRVTQDGEQIWIGKAHDADHALDKCFSDESPGSLERFTLQRWDKVKLSRTITGQGWVTEFSNKCLAAC